MSTTFLSQDQMNSHRNYRNAPQEMIEYVGRVLFEWVGGNCSCVGLFGSIPHLLDKKKRERVLRPKLFFYLP